MTPAELNMHIEEFYNAKNEREKLDITLAYMGAYWQRVKRMPNLKKLLEGENPKKVQTDEDMLEQIKKLNDALGGETF